VLNENSDSELHSSTVEPDGSTPQIASTQPSDRNGRVAWCITRGARCTFNRTLILHFATRRVQGHRASNPSAASPDPTHSGTARARKRTAMPKSATVPATRSEYFMLRCWEFTNGSLPAERSHHHDSIAQRRGRQAGLRAEQLVEVIHCRVSN